jgi:hypothetical protein
MSSHSRDYISLFSQSFQEKFDSLTEGNYKDNGWNVKRGGAFFVGRDDISGVRGRGIKGQSGDRKNKKSRTEMRFCAALQTNQAV